MIKMMDLSGIIQKSGIKRLLSDKQYLSIKYRMHFGYWMNWKSPKTFNEKLQWLKIFDRQSRYIPLVDKYEVKKDVSHIIGEDYIIPTYGVWDTFDDIDFSELPNQFVLKCTHDSGSIIICKDIDNFDKQKAKTILSDALKREYYWDGREWIYKETQPRIIAEEFIQDSNGELNDFKFFCFNGIAKLFKIDFDRYTDHHANYYDRNLSLLPFGEADYPPVPSKKLEIPKNIGEMFSLAEKLAKDIPFVRVDFYNVDGKIYFGEMTFYPAGGMGKFTTAEADELLGSWIDINS